MKQILEVKNLYCTTDTNAILKDVSFSLSENETLVILGRNGAGKSTLVRSIAGYSELNLNGSIFFYEQDISNMSPNERATEGIFLCHQTPPAIDGLTISELLRSALEARGERISLHNFKKLLAETSELLQLEPFATERDLGSAFSGGERKKLEILQMLVLKPKLVIFDEIDSGLDQNASKLISAILRDYQSKTKASYIIISHNFKLLDKLKPSSVIVLNSGRIEQTGSFELLEHVKNKGYR